ncbi:MAG: acyl-CoA thioesterase/BAAT N-terminal domain-containing protein [Actinobacteria bacterium]|nr:acyl-CoA thioesterase/BAAT N-terminal domain-containing protein [Actinomycetota bacterium]
MAKALPARSRTSPSDGRSSRSGGGIFAGFAPWIVYWILVGNASFVTSVLVALGLSLANNLVALARHRTPKILEIGSTAVFALFLAIGLAGQKQFIEQWIQPLGNFGFFAIVAVSLAMRKPFTIQYAEEQTPPELWDTDGFRYVNYFLTWVWAAAMGLMTVVSTIPPIVEGSATMQDAGSPLSIAFYWVVPFTLMGIAILVTIKYPDWFGNIADDADDVPADGPDLPIAPTTASDQPSTGDAELAIVPAEALIDEPVSLRVQGIGAGESVVLRASTVDVLGHRWKSEASFVADERGIVDTASMSPLDGTYDRVDASGWLWSMRFASDDTTPSLFVPSLDATGVHVEAVVAGGATLTRTLIWRGANPEVSVREVSEDGVVARLLLPAGDGPFPGVVLFGGSEGGLDGQFSNAALLASRGYAAGIVGYFGSDGLPPELKEIPLETIARGVRWFASLPAVDADQVAAMAISRGSEALLATLARVDDLPVRSVVAVSPSALTWEGLGDRGPLKGVSAWTFAGEPVPAATTVPRKLYDDMTKQAFRARGRRDRLHPPLMHMGLSYTPTLDDQHAVAAASIEAERIAVPLLLLAGGDDQIWPSSRMAEMIESRRDDAGVAGADHVQVWPGAGHFLRMGHLPTAVSWSGPVAFGGTPAGTATADAELGPRVLEFLAATLG